MAKLRWFAEEMPELPVIAAGSLLDFAIADHSFSMPVGRIEYLYLEPMSFEEYLVAKGNSAGLDFLRSLENLNDISQALHSTMMESFKEYLLVGGLPSIVKTWIESQDLTKMNTRQHGLITTYREDFTKYQGRISIERLEEVMLAVPRMLGQKFVYANVNPDIQSLSIKQSLGLLEKARVCHVVSSSAGNGIPLGSEINPKFFKTIFIDTGLASTLLGINYSLIQQVENLEMINKGALAEQVVGQLLRTLFPSYQDPELYYWQRTEKGTQAEVDYLIQHQNQIIPIEVKSGSTGTLRSLHVFMQLKQSRNAVRIYSGLPTMNEVNVTMQNGEKLQYQLLSIPFYLIGQLHRLCKNLFIFE